MHHNDFKYASLTPYASSNDHIPFKSALFVLRFMNHLTISGRKNSTASPKIPQVHDINITNKYPVCTRRTIGDTTKFSMNET